MMNNYSSAGEAGLSVTQHFAARIDLPSEILHRRPNPCGQRCGTFLELVRRVSPA